MPTSTFVNELTGKGVSNPFAGKNSQIDQAINNINNALKKDLSRNLDLEGKPINQSSFLLTSAYVSSYSQRIEEFLEQVKNRQKLIEMGNVYFAEFSRLQNVAETSSEKFSYMSVGAWDFVKHHGITWDNKGNDRKHDKDEWEINKTGLNSWIKSRTNEVQTDITKLNDLINKQNQIVQSQGTILKKVIESLESLIKNMI